METAIPILIRSIPAARILTAAAISIVSAFVTSLLIKKGSQGDAKAEAEEAINDLLSRVLDWVNGPKAVEELSENTKHHILAKGEHKFTKDCGIVCVLKAITNSVLERQYQIDNEGGCWVIHLKGTCSHGCNIIIRIFLPKDFKSSTKGRVSTAYHSEECRA